MDSRTFQTSDTGDGANERSPLLARSFTARPAPSPIARPRPKSTSRSNHGGGSSPVRTRSFIGITPNRPVLRKFSGTFQRKELKTLDDQKLWYDQFTSVDWLQDTVSDSFRKKELRARRGFRGKTLIWLDSALGWIVVAIVGLITAFIAYGIVKSEFAIFDLKFGRCSRGWFISRMDCCEGESKETCSRWLTWSQLLRNTDDASLTIDFFAYIAWMVVLASIACLITLANRLVAPTATPKPPEHGIPNGSATAEPDYHPPKVMYPVSGSGVAEVRVILSGFVLRGFLGGRTLVMKTFGLILSVSSGLCLGKEGPLAHIATCVGDVVARRFSKYSTNEGNLREILSAAAAGGLAVAFGAPISGVLFSLEEVSYYFPPQTLFRTFFCSLSAALTLKFLNPYSTGKIVLFSVQFNREWNYLGMIMFMFLGVLGGALGALFIKATRLWAGTFRSVSIIKNWPLLEVVLVALISGLVSYWNQFTTMPITELLLQLFSPCDNLEELNTSLCPARTEIPSVIGHLLLTFVIKAFLTTITFGIKVPAGIYIPSMVVGGLLGRTIGHTVQYLAVHYPQAAVFSQCSPLKNNLEDCVVPGAYDLLAAGATMCGVTRLTLTLAVILFELTGSLDFVLPFSLTIFVAKFTADAIEPLSIYDVQTRANSLPFVSSKSHPRLKGTLSSITHPPSDARIIDIPSSSVSDPLPQSYSLLPHSLSVSVPASDLRHKLNTLTSLGEPDGGIPLVYRDILVGLLPCHELAFALDQLTTDNDGVSEERLMVRLLAPANPAVPHHIEIRVPGNNDEEDGDLSPSERDVADLTALVDRAPITLDVDAPMEVVYECFSRLGLRNVCVLRCGRFAGMLHKKAFVQYLHEHERDKGDS